MNFKRFVLVTGLSGAGKSQAMKAFEDLGFYCLDNLPPAMLSEFVSLAACAGIERLALSLDSRTGGPFGDAYAAVAALQARHSDFDVLYLEADVAALVRRYSETRQRHPWAKAGEALESAIDAERLALQPFRSLAAAVWNTSALTHAGLRARIAGIYGEGSARPLEIFVVSFGFKHGLPPAADLVFDVRFLPNPNYVPELKALAGTDADVAGYLAEKPETRRFLAHLFDLLDYVVPQYAGEGKARLEIALGCTGGRHRSVYVAERVAAHLRAAGAFAVSLRHRQLQPA